MIPTTGVAELTVDLVDAIMSTFRWTNRAVRRGELHLLKGTPMANVNVTYDEMRSAATRLNAGREEITAKLEELQKLVNSLVNGGFVTDTASKQFEDSYIRFTRGAGDTIDGLQQMSSYLTKAADTFQDADKALSSALNTS